MLSPNAWGEKIIGFSKEFCVQRNQIRVLFNCVQLESIMRVDITVECQNKEIMLIIEQHMHDLRKVLEEKITITDDWFLQYNVDDTRFEYDFEYEMK